MTDGQSACLSWCWVPIWSRWPDFYFLSDSYRCLDVRRPLWREDGSVIYSYIFYGPCQSNHSWSKSRRTHDYILLSHVRVPQTGGPGPRIYIPQERGGPVVPPGTGFYSRRFLRLAELRWRYSNPPPHVKAFKAESRVNNRSSDRTSQQTHYVSGTKSARLMFFKETVAVYCENRMTQTNTLCRWKAEF
jgi:hypothetical protein